MQWQWALRLLVEMQQQGLEPDVVTCSSLIDDFAKANQPQQASEVIRARPAHSEEDSQPDQPLPDPPLGALRTRRAQAKVKSASTKSDRRETLGFDSFPCKALANPSSKSNRPKQTPDSSQILRQERDVPSALSRPGSF